MPSLSFQLKRECKSDSDGNGFEKPAVVPPLPKSDPEFTRKPTPRLCGSVCFVYKGIADLGVLRNGYFMSEAWCKPHEIKGKSGALIEIHAQPGASRTEVRGIHGDRLKIAVKAPPVEGAANEAILGFLSEALNIPGARVHLIRGSTSRQKTIFIEGASNSEIVASSLAKSK